MSGLLRFLRRPSRGAKRTTGSLILWYYLTGALTLLFALATTVLIHFAAVGRERDSEVFRHLQALDLEVDNVADAATHLIGSPSERSAETYSAQLERSLNALKAEEERFPWEKTEVDHPLTCSTWPSVERVQAQLDQTHEAGRSLVERRRSGTLSITDLRILAANVLSSARGVAGSIDALRNGQEKAKHELFQQRFGLLRGLMVVLAIAMIFQCFAVFIPLCRRFDLRHLELQTFKEQAEVTLKELGCRNEETKKQQAELEDRLNENQVISENFRIATQRLQTVLASVPIPCVGIDMEGCVYEWNSAAERQFGYAHFDLFEMKIHEYLIGPEDRAMFEEKIAETIRLDKSVTFEMPATTRDESRMLCEWNMMPMRGANGEITSLVVTANDVTERVLQQERLSELAFKDALTGLCNRRSFLQATADKWDAVSQNNPMTVVLMDVDKFKIYNDTFGHPAGDALLRRLGEIFSSCTPAAYIPARYGGEEFIVLLPGTTEDEGVAFAEQLRAAVEAKTKDLHGATASFGVATTTDADSCSQQLIQAADMALYQSKHNGRNQVTLWKWDETDEAAA